jgi:hypothetical protein
MRFMLIFKPIYLFKLKENKYSSFLINLKDQTNIRLVDFDALGHALVHSSLGTQATQKSI